MIIKVKLERACTALGQNPLVYHMNEDLILLVMCNDAVIKIKSLFPCGETR